MHTKKVLKECGIHALPTSSRDFISKNLCEIKEGQLFYRKLCLDGTFQHCGGLQHMPISEHMEISTHLVRNELLELKKYKIVAYNTKYGKEEKMCDLFIQNIPMY